MTLPSSILVANRGEIACRVFRTARRLGIRAVAVYSEADAQARHVREADEAILIGPGPARESYLLGANILAAATRSGVEAVHPGYGFLSENPAFAESVVASGLTWIGPPAAAMRAMGSKDEAKRLMAAAGVPVTPGYLGEDQSPERLAEEARAIGWPVLIKAVAGGGGKGMRKVERASDFRDAWISAKREAAAAFGDDRVILETYVANPRHIEVQVFGDSHGQVVHLFERDCSLQRRHQKVIEEAPAPGMDPATRESLCASAVQAARAVNYQGAGTIEFIADASDGLRADRIWFMEMNTRLQVEHPVTEAITGLDLVEWQIRVAAGERLPLDQSRIVANGHAVEARLYAEDPAAGFLPSTGPLKHLRLGSGVRVDSGVEQGDQITPFYDPLIAKLIAHAPMRAAAAATLAKACAHVQIWPVKTNAGFLAQCLVHPVFRSGAVHTRFIEDHLDELASPPPSGIGPGTTGRLGAAGGGSGAGMGPWRPASGATAFRVNGDPATLARVYLDGVAADQKFDFLAPHEGCPDGDDGWIVFDRGVARSLTSRPRRHSPGEGRLGDGAIRAPMPGRVVAVHLADGDPVSLGQIVVVLEAMKMEHALAASADGVVADLAVAQGDQVLEGAVLARVRPRP